MSYKISTTLETITNVWILLDDAGYTGLLDGAPIEVTTVQVFNWALREGKLSELCQLITDSNENFKKKEIKEVIGLLTNFFRATVEQFAVLKSSLGLSMQQKTEVAT